MLGNLAAEGVSLERLKERSYRNPRAAPIPFADRRFGTPSGKFEFITAFSSLPTVMDGSFHLVATKTRRMINSQILPEDLPQEPVVRINPTVLSERGFADGDRAWIVSKVGKVKARLTADEKVRRDVVLFNPALWQGDPCGVNQLREAFLTDLGNSAAMHQTRVFLRAE
jgi:anaerobic selenocysteine-containing dehydrogenase